MVIANAIGREDEDAVHRAVHTAVVISVLGGVLVTLFGELAAGAVLRSLNVPEEVLPYALLYLRIYLLGVPVILLYNFEAAIFRSVGDTKVPLQTLAFSGVLNVLLNLFFVIVLHMTVNGVATATVISNAISSMLLFVRLRRSDKAIHLEWTALRIDRKSLQKILQIGFPAGIQSAVFSVSNKENLDIFDFVLTDAEMQQIAALDTERTAFSPRTTGPAVDAFLKAALDDKV